MFRLLGFLASLLVLTGCVAPHRPFDYTAFKESHPKSILVLPPVNHSPDVNAGSAMLSQMTYPLAESGYYVFPVTLVDETLKQNGLSTPTDIHAISHGRLQQIFGADAALYVTVTEYGSSYRVLDSVTMVSAKAELVDLRTGRLLWKGQATGTDNAGYSHQGGGLPGMLVMAIVKQVINTVSDTSYKVAGITSQLLLSAPARDGILYGYRSPYYGKDQIE